MMWLRIPYDRADCVRLTRLFLRARGVRTRDPRMYPEAWQKCSQAEAQVVTYGERRHIAAIDGGYVLETRQQHASQLIPLDRLKRFGIEYWRACP